MDIAGLLPSDRRVDGVVQMVLEATQNNAHPLTKERLFGWHMALFPDPSRSIQVGLWRDDARGAMQVVSGTIGREPWIKPLQGRRVVQPPLPPI